MNPGRTANVDALLSSSACSVEILVHRFLLSAVFLPFALLVFLFLTFKITVSLLSLNLSDDLRRLRGLPETQKFILISDEWQLSIAIGLVLVVAAVSARRYWRSTIRLESAVSTGRRYREPTGAQGLTLTQRVESLWSQVGPRRVLPPPVLWFANPSVLAQAMVRSDRSEIAVSTGLWERIQALDPIADAILLHELAHLRYRDPVTFRRMAAQLESAVSCVALLFHVLAVTTSLLMLQQVLLAILDHRQLGFAFRQGVVVAGIGAIALLLCSITAAAVRRYVGLITALIELRADVRAAHWSGGLSRFADLISACTMVHRSTWTDRARSLFSLDLTHFSETERLEILRSPEQLMTPKVRYFGFSLVLVSLLPLNGLTPLFEGGILDWAATVAVAVGLTSASAAMLTIAARAKRRISAMRLMVLSVCSVLFSAGCHINLYTFAYSLSTAAVEVGMGRPSLSENGTTLSLANFVIVMSYPFRDIARQLAELWSGGALVVGMVIVMAVFTGMQELARNPGRFGRLRWPVPAIVSVAGGVGVVLDAYDPWRGSIFETTLLGRVCLAWAAFVDHVPMARFTLGACLAVSVLLLSRAIDLAINLSARGKGTE